MRHTIIVAISWSRERMSDRDQGSEGAGGEFIALLVMLTYILYKLVKTLSFYPANLWLCNITNALIAASDTSMW